MKPRLYLIDAHAYLHRAYHALPPLNNSRGEPVGALYGFARTLLQLLRREKPELVAVCFDHPEPTFRHKAFAPYKATRKELDADLVGQLKSAAPLARAMGLACVEQPGYEADDLMATLARRAVEEGLEAVLVTADKDALQLVGPGVRVLRDVTNSVWMESEQVEAKLGVPPSLVVDYLSLVGDASDNVPGVKGVGPVGASKLLKRFGGLDGVLAAARRADPEVPAKTAKALLAAEGDIPLYRRLIALRADVPLSLKPSQCAPAKPEEATLRPLFEGLEFGSLLKELLPASFSAAPLHSESAKTAPDWKDVEPEEWLRGLDRSTPLLLSCLRSAPSLVDASPVHLALALEDGRSAVFDRAACGRWRSQLSALLTGGALKSVYGLKELLWALDEVGLPAPAPVFDAQLARYCLNPARPKAEAFAGGDWKGPLLSRLGKAAGQRELSQELKNEGVLALYEMVERPLVEILYEMERLGVSVDAAYLSRLGAEFDSELERLQGELDGLAGLKINVNSPKQLAGLLYDTLALPVPHKTAKGGRSTDEESLRFLCGLHPIPAKVLDYRELSKLKSTYIDGLLSRLDARSGRVHTTFDQTGTETGRLSSVNPNLQNIPIRSAAGQRIRRAFVAPPGCVLLSADYSQIDLRVLAHLCGDPLLVDSFKKGEDIHTRTASEVFKVAPEAVDKEMRRRAKAVNFGIVYGQTPFGLAIELGISQHEAAGIIRSYFERYGAIQRWAEANLEEARRTGAVRTFLGRLRRLPELSAQNTAQRQAGERAARNTPVQGGSADVIKLAMLKVRAGLEGKRFKSRLALQIHDELLFETPRSEVAAFSKWVRATMEGAVELSVPLVVDVKAGANWRDMEVVAR